MIAKGIFIAHLNISVTFYRNIVIF